LAAVVGLTLAAQEVLAVRVVVVETQTLAVLEHLPKDLMGHLEIV
jgi:hypothetical protein